MKFLGISLLVLIIIIAIILRRRRTPDEIKKDEYDTHFYGL